MKAFWSHSPDDDYEAKFRQSCAKLGLKVIEPERAPEHPVNWGDACKLFLTVIVVFGPVVGVVYVIIHFIIKYW